MRAHDLRICVINQRKTNNDSYMDKKKLIKAAMELLCSGCPRSDISRVGIHVYTKSTSLSQLVT